MKTFVIGDVHGRIEALKEVLNKSKFNYDNDKLICLGDVVDGGYNTYECVEELLKIKNLIYLMGNHDEWFLNHIKTGWAETIWLNQGGTNTLRSYGAKVKEENIIDTTQLNIPVTHQDFFNKALYYYIMDNMIFVHAGFNPKIPKMESQSKQDLTWDRNLIEYAKKHKVPGYKHVFIGHTPTQTQGSNPNIKDIYKPITYNNLTMMDTGAGWSGKLTIMNITTREFWQSQQQIGGR